MIKAIDNKERMVKSFTKLLLIRAALHFNMVAMGTSRAAQTGWRRVVVIVVIVFVVIMFVVTMFVVIVVEWLFVHWWRRAKQMTKE